MTCIVGLVTKTGKVIIGGDSAGTSSNDHYGVRYY